MKYWEYLIYFFLLAAAGGFFVYIWIKIKRDHYLRLTIRAFSRQPSVGSGESFFSSYGLKQAVNFLLRLHKAEAQRALLNLTQGNPKPAARLMSKNGDTLNSLLLEAYIKPEDTLKKLKRLTEKFPQNDAAVAETAFLLFILGDLNKSEEEVSKIPATVKGYIAAKKNYLEAFFALRDGDLLTASEKVSRAIRIFEKEQAYYEVATAHLLMGTIYRVTAVSDVAELMFRTSLKIFQNLKAVPGEADANGHLGMLMVMEERFDEAADYFKQAKNLNQIIKRKQAEAEIINQQSLLALILGKTDNSEHLARQALTIHKELDNANGQGFSLELLSRISLKRKKFAMTAECAAAAQNYYARSNNVSALLETLYLEATAFFEDDKMDEAEKSLRRLIAKAQESAGCFHIANAYNLLGLVFLQKGNYQRAKGLFRQSLDYEQRDERLCGIATDYVNISLTEARLGDIDQSLKTLETALEYARADGDEELCKLICKQIQQLENQ